MSRKSLSNFRINYTSRFRLRPTQFFLKKTS